LGLQFGETNNSCFKGCGKLMAIETEPVKVRKAEVSEHELTEDDLAMTIGCFTDKFSHYLGTFKEILENNGTTTTIRPYVKQAEDLMYQIPVFKPVPPFIIYKSQMPKEIKKVYYEFKNFSYKHEFEAAILDAVGRVFENLNSEYYHRSVKKLLWVKAI
jgi:hypothetical protein